MAPVPQPFLLPSMNVPLLIVVPPLKVLMPESVRLPLVVFVNPPKPETTPERVTAPAPVPPTVVLAARMMVLEIVAALALFWFNCGWTPLLRTNERVLPPTVNAGSELPRFQRLSWKLPARSLVLVPA